MYGDVACMYLYIREAVEFAARNDEMGEWFPGGWKLEMLGPKSDMAVAVAFEMVSYRGGKRGGKIRVVIAQACH